MANPLGKNYDLNALPVKYKIFVFLLPLLVALAPLYLFLNKSENPELTSAQLTKLCGGSLVNNSNVFSVNTKYVPCYMEYFKKIAKKEGIDKTVVMFNTYSKESNGLMGECHSVGHALGAWAFTQFGEKAFNNNYADCAFAYGHGLLQASARELTPDQIVSKLGSVCAQEAHISDCVHGFGHSLGQSPLTVIQADYICEKLDSKLKQYATKFPVSALHSLCTEGWVMEKYTADPRIWFKYTDVKQALTWCAGISGYGEAGCVGIAMRNYINASRDKSYNSSEVTYTRLAQFADYCSTVKAPYHVICVQHLGMTIGEVYDLNVENSIVAKKYMIYCDGEDTFYCQASFMNSRLSKLGGNGTRLSGFCKFLVGEFKDNCYAVIKNPMK